MGVPFRNTCENPELRQGQVSVENGEDPPALWENHWLEDVPTHGGCLLDRSPVRTQCDDQLSLHACDIPGTKMCL